MVCSGRAGGRQPPDYSLRKNESGFIRHNADDFYSRIARNLVETQHRQSRQVARGHLLQARPNLRANEHYWLAALPSELSQLIANEIAQPLDGRRRSADEQAPPRVIHARGNLVLDRGIERQYIDATFGIAVAGADGASQAMADVFTEDDRVFRLAGIV